MFGLISAFATQPLKSNISFNITRKELKRSVMVYFYTLFSLVSLICI